MFLSLAILINTARQEILAEYGISLPLYGRVRFPTNVLGLDLRFYPSPVVTAGFSGLFYAGVFCLGLVTMERLMSLRSIEELFRIGDIRELDLLPPYKRVWMSSGDKGLNPLSEEPERVVGSVERSDNVSDHESLIGGLEVNVAEAIVEEAPPIQVQSSMVDLKPQVWSHSRQVNKREIAMVRSAAKVIVNHGSPIEYRELLSRVYRDLLEFSTGDFGSIREIETALLRHVGQELVLIVEESQVGVLRKWWIGDEPVADSPAPQWEKLERMKTIAKLAETRMKMLREK